MTSKPTPPQSTPVDGRGERWAAHREERRTHILDAAIAVIEREPVGAEIHVQDALHGSTYSRIGSFDPSLISSFGASFLAVSPDGSTLAIGDGNFGPGASVHFLDAASLDPNSASNVTSVAAVIAVRAGVLEGI